MKHKIINKWIKALESGEYKQTKGKLYNTKTHGFCCLGVLTNEYCETKNDSFDEVTGYESIYNRVLNEPVSAYSFYGPDKKEEAEAEAEDALETSTIKQPVAKWIGLKGRVNIKDLKFEPRTLEKYQDNSYEDGSCEGNILVTSVLATLNDGGVKFKDIAKFIKDNKKVLFR